jgi:hypothetical protein
MDPVRVALSSRALQQIQAKGADGNFTFIIGRCRYQWPVIAAEFLSPRVCRLRSIDATIEEVSLQTDDFGGHFERFLLLGRGEAIEIDEKSRNPFLHWTRELKNSELAAQISSREHISIENACELLAFHSETLCDISSDLAFVASHFCEVAKHTTKLNSSVISAVLSHPSLTIESEDFLYRYVMNSSLDLLEFVRFENLPPDVISDFLDTVCIEDMNLSVIQRLKSRLVCQCLNASSDGIIAQLTRDCGGNVHDHGIVTITSSMPHNYRQVAKNVTDNSPSFFNSGHHHSSDDIGHERNNWICYDFKDRRIIPSHYSIRSYDAGEGNGHPKNWVVEVSADGDKWTVIDRRENSRDLNGKNITRTFAVGRREECRFVRLVNIARNWYGDDGLCISVWDIFGSISQ